MYLGFIPLLATLALHTQPSIGATLSQPLNATASDHTQCTSLKVWTGGTPPLMSDCVEAIDEIWNKDVAPHQGRDYEFVSPGVGRATSFPPVMTPKKYIKGEQAASLLVCGWLMTDRHLLNCCRVAGYFPYQPSSRRWDTHVF